jgi:hypothetical protein
MLAAARFCRVSKCDVLLMPRSILLLLLRALLLLWLAAVRSSKVRPPQEGDNAPRGRTIDPHWRRADGLFHYWRWRAPSQNVDHLTGKVESEEQSSKV